MVWNAPHNNDMNKNFSNNHNDKNNNIIKEIINYLRNSAIFDFNNRILFIHQNKTKQIFLLIFIIFLIWLMFKFYDD
ncbi:hypothetical protein [Buchnera aphidicola]|uniref:hypothetical protein n=1 Tax=Buchnera aphidicola TaxID=9 RepID=UPI003463935F